MGLVLEAVTNAAMYAALVLAVGACASYWLLLPRLDGAGMGSATALRRRVSTIASRAAVVFLVAVVSRLLAHAISVFGASEAFSWTQISLIAFQSRWGGGWRVQAVGALLLVPATAWTRDGHRAGWVLASLMGVGLCFALPLVGHAAGSAMRVLVHASHLFGASLWLGTLGTVFCLWLFEERQDLNDNAVERRLPTGFLPVPLRTDGARRRTDGRGCWLGGDVLVRRVGGQSLDDDVRSGADAEDPRVLRGSQLRLFQLAKPTSRLDVH